MIYICVSTRNHAPTVGLVLWKVRQVFTEFPREYHLLVADESGNDETAELLERYQRVLPMTVLRSERPRSDAASLEALLRDALGRTDRPKRDIAIVVPPDFAVSPDALPELVRRIDSGADLVVAETFGREHSFARRLIRRSATWLLRPGVRVPGVRDLMSDCYALRLITLKLALRQQSGSLLESGNSACARAELIARAASHARQLATVPLPARAIAQPLFEQHPLTLAVALFRAGRALRIDPSTARVQS